MGKTLNWRKKYLLSIKNGVGGWDKNYNTTISPFFQGLALLLRSQLLSLLPQAAQEE